LVGDRDSFDLLGKFIHGDQQVRVVTSR
jgi:hypothetical protein